MKLMKQFGKKSAQGLVEYALILGLIAVVTAAVITLLGTHAKDNLEAVDDQLTAGQN